MYLGRYTYQDEDLPVLDCFWLASIVDGEITLDHAEASEYRWLSLREPPELRFPPWIRQLWPSGRVWSQPLPGNSWAPAP